MFPWYDVIMYVLIPQNTPCPQQLQKCNAIITIHVVSVITKEQEMKGQSEIAYLPKFANMMLIVMVIVITEILYIILICNCFENQ